jgi:hypothetical protein
MLRPPTSGVEPEAETDLEIKVVHKGTMVDESSIDSRGDLTPWGSIEPPVLRLFIRGVQ